MNKRIAWIDTARGLSIFLVVLGHTILPHSWLVYIFSFHMPLFFFLSGFLYNPEKHTNSWEFIKKKIQTILWPYLVFFLFGYIYWILFFNSNQYLDPIWRIFYSSDKLYAPFIPLWFLTCLFLVEVYFHFLVKFLKKWTILVAIVLSTLLGFYLAHHNFQLFWSLDIALVSLLFYYLGFITKTYQQNLKKINVAYLSLIGLIFLTLNFFLARWQGLQISMIYRVYGIEWIFIVLAISGIIGWIILAKLLKTFVFNKSKIFEYLGKNSLIILGLHTVFYYYVSDFFQYFLKIHPKTSILFSFIYTILTLVIMAPFIYFINEKMPILIGRPNNKKKREDTTEL